MQQIDAKQAGETFILTYAVLEVRDRALLGALRELGVLGEEPARVARLRQLPVGLARRSSSASSTSRSIVCCVGVDHDAVAVVDERDRAAVDRLGRNVPDAEPVRAAARSDRR